MGGLLAELPWFLGGNEDEAQQYLERAIQADSDYTNARLLLGKLFVKQKRIEEAKQQLKAVLAATHPHYPYNWAHTFRPEAERLLHSLEEARP